MDYNDYNFRNAKSILKDKLVLSKVDQTLQNLSKISSDERVFTQIVSHFENYHIWEKNYSLTGQNEINEKYHLYDKFNKIAIGITITRKEFVTETILKLMLGYNDLITDVGIIIVPNSLEDAEKLASSYQASPTLEYCKSYLETYSSIVTIPVWVIGLIIEK